MVGGDTKQPDEDRLKDILLKQIMIIRCGGIRTSEEKKIGGFTLVKFTRIYCKSIYDTRLMNLAYLMH